MTSEVAKRDEGDLGFADSDMTMIMMIMMMVMMMSMMSQFIAPMAQTQTEIAQTLRAQSYHGTEDPRTLNATNQLQWINLVYDYPFTPWISAYLINDGPSAIEIGINYPDDRFTMKPNETITINRTGALDEKISIIFYICYPGLRSTVRVTGTL